MTVKSTKTPKITKQTSANKNPVDKTKYPNCYEGYQYALDIVDGKITASIYTIGACKRFLSEVHMENKRWRFNYDRAERYLRIAQQFKHVKGKWKDPQIKFEPWQKWVWMNIEGFVVKDTGFRRFRFAHIDIARGNGKPLAVNTIVPTPDGLKEWKEIGIGSKLYDRNGNVCTVVNKNATFLNPKSQKMIFSDGTEIITGLEHEWFTSTKTERSRKARHSKKETLRDIAILEYEKVRTTQEIKDTLKVGGETNHAVYVTKPIKGSKKNLPIDPYLLGYWLGKGAQTSNAITVSDEDVDHISKMLTERGIEFSVRGYADDRKANTVKPLGIVTPLKEMNLWGNKHIPDIYLTASEKQRRELLQGLLDADGAINRINNRVTITSGNSTIWKSLEYLICSLGYKVSTATYKISENNNYKSDTLFMDISFTPRGNEKVFSFPRKYSRQVPVQGNHFCGDKRYIVDIVDCEPTEMFCVEVDSPDHSFLVTERCIATHNSLMASIAVLFNLCLDSPMGNKVSTVATTKDQARIVFDDARAMAEGNSAFLRKTKCEVQKHKIIHEDSNSEARPLSSEAGNLDGLNDVLAVCDELHAMKRSVFEVITSGMSKRFDSLTLCVTTAGEDDTSVGFAENQYAKELCLGRIKDDSRFAVVYTLDKEDNIYDPEVWVKANPNMAVSVDPETFKSKLFKTLEEPRDLPNFKIKHLNIWTSEEASYFDVNKWDKCADKSLTWDSVRHLPCMAAVDLAQYKDLSTRAYLFYDKDKDKYYFLEKTFVPSKILNTKIASDFYNGWVEDGHLLTYEGEVINFPKFGDDLYEECSQLNIGKVAYDHWAAIEMAQRLEDRLDMVAFTQNKQNFSEPTKKLDALIKDGQIVHNGSPLVRWCLANVVVDEDSNSNVKPRKPSNDEKKKVDPIIALIMTIGLWIQDDTVGSVYEERGFLTI